MSTGRRRRSTLCSTLGPHASEEAIAWGQYALHDISPLSPLYRSRRRPLDLSRRPPGEGEGEGEGEESAGPL